MKYQIFSWILFLSSASFLYGQQPHSADKQNEPVSILESERNDPTVDLSDNAVPAVAVAPGNDYVRPKAKARFYHYVKNMFGPSALGGSLLAAGYSTGTNSPKEWGGQWTGFGRRAAWIFGKNVIMQTAAYGLDEGLRLDSQFYRSQKKDFRSRFSNAMVSTVTARNAEGKRVIGLPRLIGTYGASILAVEASYPDRYDYKDGLRIGTISLGVNAAFNLFKEFIWKK